MMRVWKRQFAALVLAIAGNGVAMGAMAADFDGMVDADSGKLHVVQMGSGPITVIFEAGFASDLTVWRRVAPDIAKRAQVLAYSRAGTGKSPARAQPQSIAQSTADLAALLARVNARPPYILVGHSYGGFLIRHFAAAYPAQVAGLVFVDPADEGLEAELKRIDAAAVLQDQRALMASMPPKWQGDLLAIQKILDQGKLPPMAALPDVPAVLLTSVRSRAGSDFFQETPVAVKLKRERHQAFFSQFGNGAHVVTSQSGHTIQMQEPELVIAAIDQVLSGASQAAKRQALQAARQALMVSLEKAAAQLKENQSLAAETQVAAAIGESRLGEAEINTLGFNVLTKGKQAALAELILKANAQTYPQSHNAADSYGEALLALQRKAEAARQFQRALELGRAAGASPKTLETYQQNLDKALNPT